MIKVKFIKKVFSVSEESSEELEKYEEEIRSFLSEMIEGGGTIQRILQSESQSVDRLNLTTAIHYTTDFREGFAKVLSVVLGEVLRKDRSGEAPADQPSGDPDPALKDLLKGVGIDFQDPSGDNGEKTEEDNR